MKDSFAPASRAIMVTAALVIIIAGMKLAAPLLVPFLLSIFIAVISFPLMSQLQQSGLSKGLSLTLVMLLVVFIGIGLTLLIGSSLTDFSRTLPDYQQRITTEWGQAIVWLKDHGISVAEQLKGIADPAAAMGLISSILKGFGNVLTNSFLIILTVVFILMETAGVTQKVLLLRDQADDEQSDKKVFSQVFVEKLRDYMSMKTIISMMTGIIVAIAMWLIGLDYPVLWGVLAFMLNFVPNIGACRYACHGAIRRFLCLAGCGCLCSCQCVDRKCYRAQVHGQGSGPVDTGGVRVSGLLGLGVRAGRYVVIRSADYHRETRPGL
jgi:predicted PurR-regulated permease PerM